MVVGARQGLRANTRGGRYQAVGVVTHVPQRNQGQGHPGAILRGDLVLSSHNRRDRPPATIRKKQMNVWNSQKWTAVWNSATRDT